MLTTIEVTQEHINKGIQEHACACPVALAIAPLLRDGLRPHVFTDDVEIRSSDTRRRKGVVYPPEYVGRKIEQYDDDEGMEPFSFQMNIPEGLLR